MPSINKLILVTTGLRLEDGGAASLSRLIAIAVDDYGLKNNIAVEILDLGQRTDILQDMNIQFFNGSQLALALAIVTRALRSRHTAFVFGHFGPSRTFGVMPRLFLPRYMIWLLGVEVWRHFSFERRRAMRYATIRVAISSFTERRTRALHNWLPPTEVLLLTLEDRPARGEIDNKLLGQIGKKAILIVGRLSSLERYKGHDELLQIMPNILQKCPDARLVIAGQGDDLHRLQAVATGLGIEDSVMFTGFVNDATLQALYQNSCIFAMPSRGEGFGLVYLEAMKAACPCVALRDSPAAEIIQDGVTGILIDYDSPDQLTDALLRLLLNDSYNQRLGAVGRNRWREQFTFDAFQLGFHKLLDQLCRN